MADLEINEFNQVTTPALTDVVVCQQSGTTKKQTVTQLLSNIDNLDSGSTLTGTETILIRTGGVNYRITMDNLIEFMRGNL